jgi:WD repeat-containing protein 1 (actin-interacting protein 1)
VYVNIKICFFILQNNFIVY